MHENWYQKIKIRTQCQQQQHQQKKTDACPQLTDGKTLVGVYNKEDNEIGLQILEALNQIRREWELS